MELNQGTVKRCSPCDIYSTDAAAAVAATKSIKDMYAQLQPLEELAVGHGYQPFVLHPLPQDTVACPKCSGDLTSIEAGYDRFGTVSLEDRVLWIEDAGFSDDGNGPHYLHCQGCNRAYALPKAGVDYR